MYMCKVCTCTRTCTYTCVAHVTHNLWLNITTIKGNPLKMKNLLQRMKPATLEDRAGQKAAAIYI